MGRFLSNPNKSYDRMEREKAWEREFRTAGEEETEIYARYARGEIGLEEFTDLMNKVDDKKIKLLDNTDFIDFVLALESLSSMVIQGTIKAAYPVETYQGKRDGAIRNKYSFLIEGMPDSRGNADSVKVTVFKDDLANGMNQMIGRVVDVYLRFQVRTSSNGGVFNNITCTDCMVGGISIATSNAVPQYGQQPQQQSYSGGQTVQQMRQQMQLMQQWMQQMQGQQATMGQQPEQPGQPGQTPGASLGVYKAKDIPSSPIAVQAQPQAQPQPQQTVQKEAQADDLPF
ncbi:MAG: hypothetical protein LUC22_00335 [Prevotella sp.]|nr:hypothetical protein [Prevotella sp.]